MERSCSATAGPALQSAGLHPTEQITAAAGLRRETSSTATTSGKEQRSLLRALLLAALIPPILLVICVAKYGVNVPYGDEWRLIPLLAKYHDHQLTFADLFQQHNEHRILIPKLIYLAFARFTHWNLHAEMFFSIGLCLGTSAALYCLVRSTLRLSQAQLLMVWIAFNLLIFSPTQSENWLWGFQLQMFIPNLCLIVALLGLNMDRSWTVRFSVAALSTLIATFSFGNGLLLWPVLGLFMVLRREKISHLLAWAGLCCLVVTPYFVGYVPAPKSRPITGDWLDYPTYFCVFLGAALGRDGSLLRSAGTGVIALSLFAVLLFHFVRRRGDSLRSSAPWIAIGSYAIASAALAACTRVHGGPVQADDSRYITISQNLYLALIALFVLVGKRAGDSSKLGEWLQIAKRPMVAAIVVLVSISFPAALAHMQLVRQFASTSLAALQFCQVLDTTELLERQLMIPVEVTEPLQYVATLKRLGIGPSGIRSNVDLEDGQNRPQRATIEFGATNHLRASDPQHLEMGGWAFLADENVAAPVVLLAYRNAGRWCAFELCKTGQTRRDIATRFHSREYLTTGWSRTFNRDKLPPETEFVSAWAVDPFLAKTYKLPIDFRVPK